jgi:hypothetical protein
MTPFTFTFITYQRAFTAQNMPLVSWLSVIHKCEFILNICFVLTLRYTFYPIPLRNAPIFPLLPLRYHIWYPARWPEGQTNPHFHMALRVGTSCSLTHLTGHQSVTGENRAFFFHSCDRATLTYSSITNKMQHYTMVFITINALRVSGSSSAHHQEHKTVYTALGIYRAFPASYRYREWVGPHSR